MTRRLDQPRPTSILSAACASLLLICAYATSASAQAVIEAKPKAADAPKAAAAASNVSFAITYTEKVAQGSPITGRVYVMLAAAGSPGEPRFGPNWFRPQPFFARDVRDWKPGEAVVIDAQAVGFPDAIDKLAPGDYRAQAVVRVNPDTAKIGDGEGNFFGPIVDFKAPAAAAEAIKLTVDQVVPPHVFKETDRIKYAELVSPLLSAFHGREIKHQAAVILPKTPPSGKSPAVYIITGFGGDHHSAPRYAQSPGMRFAEDMTRIVLNADCGTGHHVFADSANNGPRGKALTEEFIPYLEKTFNLIPDPRARLVNGHSSGGWSSLWLQVAYPDFFGGVWSTSPDPVDFRDFQRIDVYAAGENMFKDRQGERRPLARMGTKPILFYEPFSKMEDVMGTGGQLGSFEAVFSPKGPDGTPLRLWDRKTGEIDAATAKAWESYDIRLVLERNWPTLGPKLAGKLHVITGSIDTFYLEGAVVKLKASLEKLGSDADVEIIPDKDHGNILDRNLAERIDHQMKAAVAPVLEAK
ncbi:alpha/beta hydrolase-fold protein [Paludisphaera mucosa]|uniref:Alpha/beta hydrolase-fold protein n=1 Tax=Paludisphaera mucosa TaxID=3030827 RepID=A0ABT6F7X5_9BACT|nr:alpha/beta hydrolase-fold protein [Paludisphaera mucosa]MDG3003602.1 alpha/beta hydrolase-fold protein [Paludisphaera mucosa]